ncbi:hypothetical protein J132_10253 [Termitomyces sp. J132]|nr:hypothetical protein J132_10253 [Termitomyces sp. J132]
MVCLIPGQMNYTARHIAKLVFGEIYKLHELPKAIVSDRDSYLQAYSGRTFILE